MIGYVIDVRGRSIEAQRILIEKGYRWMGHRTEPIRDKGIGWLTIYPEARLLKKIDSNCRKVFLVRIGEGRKHITWEQMLALEDV